MTPIPVVILVPQSAAIEFEHTSERIPCGLFMACKSGQVCVAQSLRFLECALLGQNVGDASIYHLLRTKGKRVRVHAKLLLEIAVREIAVGGHLDANSG